jgi:hypothetical protein
LVIAEGQEATVLQLPAQSATAAEEGYEIASRTSVYSVLQKRCPTASSRQSKSGMHKNPKETLNVHASA